jgi:ubiquitin-activating enzyme E1
VFPIYYCPDSHCNRIKDLVELVSRKKVPDHMQNLILEVTADDTTGEDVEIPYVMVKLNESA